MRIAPVQLDWPKQTSFGTDCSMVWVFGLLAFLFVSAVGLVTAGLVSNLWPILTGRDVSIALLEERGPLLPLRVMILVFSAPVLLIASGLSELRDASGGLLRWWLTLPTAVGLSFVQGIVVVVSLSAIS